MNIFTGTTGSLSALALGLLLAAGHAMAQSDKTQPPDPADANAVVPSVIYRPSLQTYRPVADTPIGDWKAANENVSKLKPAPSASAAPMATADKHSEHQQGQTAQAPAAPLPSQDHQHQQATTERCEMARMKPATPSASGKAVMKMPNCSRSMSKHEGKENTMRCEHGAMKHGDHHDYE